MAAPPERKKGVLDLLQRKGYKFHEELDLGQLDKKFRCPLPLAETKPPPPRKKKKKQDLDLEEEGFVEDDLTGEPGRSVPKTQAQLDAEAEKKERDEKEHGEWVVDFNLRRRGLDHNENQMYIETFIGATKKIYESVDGHAKHQERVLNMIGVFDPALNAVRSQSQKRVKLSKKLKVDQIRHETSREVELYRHLTETGGENAYEQSKQSLQIQREARHLSFRPDDSGGAAGHPGGEPKKTPRQRQREAIAGHRSRHIAGYEKLSVTGKVAAEVSKEVMEQYKNPRRSERQRSPGSYSRAATGTPHRSGEGGAGMQSFDGADNAKGLTGSTKRGGGKTKGAKSEDAVQSMLASEEVELDPEAPTPQELLDVEEAFRSKRKEIRVKGKEAKENANLDIVETDRLMNPVMQQAKMTGSRLDAAEGASSPLSGGDAGGGGGERGGQASKAPSSTGSYGRLNAQVGNDMSHQGGDPDKVPAAHLKLPPDIRPVAYHAVEVRQSGGAGEGGGGEDPLLLTSSAIRPHHMRGGGGLKSVKRWGNPKENVVDGEASSPSPREGRRTRYLHPLRSDPMSTDILREFPPAPAAIQESRNQALQLQPVARPSAMLNPSFAAIKGVGSMLLQAANTQLTPRITMIKREADVLPGSEHLHQSDRYSLQRGTPDLEELLGEEFSKVASQQKMEMPNFLGEGDLLRLVPGEATEPRDFYTMDAAATDGAKARRGKAPKIRKVKDPKNVPPPKSEMDLAEQAKDMIKEESSSMNKEVAGAGGTSESQRLAKDERSGGKPPAALDDRLSQRLEAIWDALEMPMMEKLGMVVKYSELQNAMLLEDSIAAWEGATKAVMEREGEIKKLIAMRKPKRGGGGASDESGDVGGGLVGELQEQQTREEIAKLSEHCQAVCDRLLKAYGDVVTLRGMPYSEDLAGGLDASIERLAGMSIKGTGLGGDKGRMRR